MTGSYLRNTTADYITGAVSACEGVRDSVVLLNGPLGCRFYHGYASGQGVLKPSELWHLRGELRLDGAMDDHLLRSQYFAGTPQVPGSNLRYEDYIFGSRDQLRRALNDIFAERRYSLLAVIQTPGTSLIGEALEGELEAISQEYGVPCLFIESPELSGNSFIGYDECTARLLELLLPKGDAKPRRSGKRVNLFGFHTYQKYLEGDLDEVTRLLGLCGVEVNCAMGANCPIERLRSIPESDANIYFAPERCGKTRDCLRSACGLPELDFGVMPIGFDLTERFVREVCALLDAEPSPALEDIEAARARAFYYIARYTGGRGFQADTRYAVEGEYSLLCSYVDYLSGYMGLRPEAVHPLYTQSSQAKPRLEKLLSNLGCSDALERDIARVKDAILIGGANTILEAEAYSENIYGIEIASPSSGYINVIPKTHLGCRGALFLLEQVLNGVKLLNAWN